MSTDARADAFVRTTVSLVLAAARDRGVPVLTGDPHFAGIPDAEML